MAQGKNKKLEQLETIALILYGVMSFRFVFFFYSFLSFVFWFLNCLDVDWLYMFNWMFIIPYEIVGNFYKANDELAVDFSLAIIGIISLITGFVLYFIVNIIYRQVLELREQEIQRIEQRKKNRKKAIKQKIAQSRNISETPHIVEDSKLVFLIQPHSNKIKRKKDDIELTFQEVEIWKQRINKRLIENINYTKPMQKGYYRKNLFLIYRDFNYADEFIYYIKPTLDSIVLEFKKYGIYVSFCFVLSAVSNIDTLERELDVMDTILSLNFINDFVVTSRFKITYENKPIHQYSMVLKGEYNLSKNLTISNRQSLYSLSAGIVKGEIK
ncbi:MAG: hypothetical protein LUH11_00170 [Candidatus Gastranaerophilales bacterium]|nr:hypothetical protein [Candidatus Gastranaerophilales bacterium]